MEAVRSPCYKNHNNSQRRENKIRSKDPKVTICFFPSRDKLRYNIFSEKIATFQSLATEACSKEVIALLFRVPPRPRYQATRFTANPRYHRYVQGIVFHSRLLPFIFPVHTVQPLDARIIWLLAISFLSSIFDKWVLMNKSTYDLKVSEGLPCGKPERLVRLVLERGMLF